MPENDAGYVNFFEVLSLTEDAKPGDVRKVYRKRMKDLVLEIAQTEITTGKRDRYLLDMAKLNAALFVLRDGEKRDAYWSERERLIALEEEWRQADANKTSEADRLRRTYDGLLRAFLGKYTEESMLEAGRDKECVENSHWDPAHERHASRLIRRYRARLHRQILERLPFFDVTPPRINWDERQRAAERLVKESAA